MLTMDGSMGEGGGQVLRTSLGLSALTGTPFRIDHIRKNRRRPGLARQHLTAVRAAATICGAEVQGDAMGSTSVTFRPGPVVAGAYHFAIGTAGSANLVLQTVLPALMCADGPSLITLEGGTHNNMSPPFDFLKQAFAPLLARMGPLLALELERHGFYPAGGGRFTASIQPSASLRPLELLARGEVQAIEPHVLLSMLHSGIGRRELKALCEALELAYPHGAIEEVAQPQGPGNAVMVTVRSEHVTELFTGFGDKGVRGEEVARGVAAEVRAYLDAGVPVSEHLADQLLIPLAIAGGGAFRTTEPTLHTRTNAEVIGRFLPVRFGITQVGSQAWEVRCERVGT